MAMCNI